MTQTKDTISYQEFQSLNSDIGEMKRLMSQMAEAISRISLLDERQQQVAGFMQRLDDRIARMESRQHESEIASAVNQVNGSRLASIEAGFRDVHLERERDKARFQTVVWMVRGLWAIAASGVVGAIISVAMKAGGA